MTSPETDQVTVRPATHADCHAIKDIDRYLISGFDRLLYCFHTDVSNENKSTYVAEISDQIIAYACGHVIDDGEVIVMREARVSDKYRGKNIIGKLEAYLINAARAKFPNLKKMAWSSLDTKACELALSRHPDMKRLQHKLAETFHTHSDILKSVCHGEAFSTLTNKYNINHIQGFPKREALKLLIEEIRYLDFAPLRPMIGWQPSGWRISTLSNQLQVTDLFISRHPDTGNIQAFSFLTTTRSDYGVRVDVELYCDPSYSSEDLTIRYLLHFIREISILHSETKIGVLFMFPPDVRRESVKAVLETELGIKTNTEGWSQNGLEFNMADAFMKQSKL